MGHGRADEVGPLLAQDVEEASARNRRAQSSVPTLLERRKFVCFITLQEHWQGFSPSPDNLLHQSRTLKRKMMKESAKKSFFAILLCHRVTEFDAWRSSIIDILISTADIIMKQKWPFTSVQILPMGFA